MKSKCFVMIIMVFMLMGCQLATDEHPINKGNDKMIGVVAIDGNIEKDLFENSKLYVEEKDEHHYDFSVLKDNGFIGSSYLVVDSIVEGGKDEKVEYLMNTGGLNTGVLDFAAIDSNVEKKITNQLHLIYDTKEVALNLYQLMQDEDDKVYILDNEDALYHITTDTVGKYGGFSISGKVSKKVNGYELAYEKIISNIDIQVVYEPIKIEIIEMNKEDKMVTSKTYLQNDLPSSYTPNNQAEYLLIKNYVLKDDEEDFEYSIVNKVDKKLNVDIKYNESICLLKSIDIYWE